MSRLRNTLLALGACLAAAALWVLADNTLEASPPPSTLGDTPSAAQLARGAYLARAGNCAACHTTRGGTPYAGGRAIDTPFGTVYAGNLTPDPDTGLGRWSSQDFWRALHHGKSRDGRLLTPVFPYTNTTLVTREDSDALWAWLRSLPPVRQATPAHDLRWPYNSQVALAVWRSLYFSPGSYQPDPARSAEWNRGAYLVRGLGHCGACHSARNALGATDTRLDLAGGLIPLQNWYAPSLTRNDEAGVGDWPVADIVSLFKTGASPRGWVNGPMAEVVLGSTRHLDDTDLHAMASFLQSLAPATAPATPTTPLTPPPAAPRAGSAAELGARVYDRHCAQCHGEQGEGVAGAYPRLAGNRALRMDNTANLVQMVLYGGYSPATAGNPRPYGMPPYVLQLSDREVAGVLSYIRSAWGNQAAEVTEVDVNHHRSTTGH